MLAFVRACAASGERVADGRQWARKLVELISSPAGGASEEYADLLVRLHEAEAELDQQR
jgi:hypothetical protein